MRQQKVFKTEKIITEGYSWAPGQLKEEHKEFLYLQSAVLSPPYTEKSSTKVKQLSQLLPFPLEFHYITFRIKCLLYQLSYLRCTIRLAGKPIQNISLPLAYQPTVFVSRHFMLLRAVISFSINCCSNTPRGLPHYNSCLIDSPSASHSQCFPQQQTGKSVPFFGKVMFVKKFANN